MSEQRRAPNVCIMGPAGTGKTHSLGTLVDAGVEVFYVDMENGLEALQGYWRDRGLEIPANLHWCRMPKSNSNFKTMIDLAKKINVSTFETLTKMQDVDKSKHDRFVQLLSILNNFVDERTGQAYGAVDEWTCDRALAIDGLTGIGKAAMSLVVGGKPVINQGEWGIGQDQVEKLLRMLADNCACWFVLLAHVEREVDEIQGGIKIMVQTLGKKLPPKIPSIFSDVILSVREGTKWSWSTANALCDLKTRNLSIRDGLQPDFGQILTTWRSRVQTPETPETPKPTLA